MKQKTITIIFMTILCVGFIAQLYARGWTTTAAQDTEYMVRSFKIGIPLLIFVGAPLIGTLIIVGIVKIIKHFGILVYNIFKVEDDDYETESLTSKINFDDYK